LKDFYSREVRKVRTQTTLLFVGIGAVILAIVAMALFFRFDYASGSHRIIPTAVDRDIWGNYQVWFRSTEFQFSSEEECYYIHRDNPELAEQVRQAIRDGKELIVYYDHYVGFYGLRAPKTSPITKIEIVGEG